MNCPRCASELIERRVGISQANACASCGGVWVPFESCEAVMPRLAELAPREAVPRPAVAAKPRCPSCGGDLVTVKAHGLKGATALTCLVCFGRWLDGADLAKTRGRGLGGLLRSLLRALLPKDRPPPPPPPGPPPPPPQPPSEESARTEVPRQDQP